MQCFKRFGPLFLPTSLTGWVVSFAAAAFCVQVFLFVDGRSHSVSDTLYGVFPFWAPTFLLWAWIAERTSRT